MLSSSPTVVIACFLAPQQSLSRKATWACRLAQNVPTPSQSLLLWTCAEQERLTVFSQRIGQSLIGRFQASPILQPVTAIDAAPAIAGGEGSSVTGRFIIRQVDAIGRIEVLGADLTVDTIEDATILAHTFHRRSTGSKSTASMCIKSVSLGRSHTMLTIRGTFSNGARSPSRQRPCTHFERMHLHPKSGLEPRLSYS